MKIPFRNLLLTVVCSLLCVTIGGADESAEIFEWTDKSGEELRQGKVFWDFMEGGAPMISLGSGLSESHALKSVQIAFSFAELPFGEYEYVRPSHSMFEHNDRVKALPARQSFLFQEKHLKLLRHMSVRHSFQTDQGEVLVGIDPKRPYGDFSYFEGEMALILKRPVSYDQQQRIELSDAVETEMTALHDEMTLAVQVFLQNAKLEPSSYQDLKYGAWERVLSD